MCIRYLGFVLLIWCPGELHAQSATQSCSAPTLDGGKFSPKRETYANGVYVTYSCDLGRKPAVEGWWARSTCQNGTWSPQPQCIVEEACIPPEIPNAKYTESPTGWYEDGQKLRITCDEAYELKNRDATALCTNGSWSSVPVCERSVNACGEPPKVLHAVIVDQRYQELFAADTELQYECVDGYTAEGAGSDKTIVCIAGAWTEGPTCRGLHAQSAEKPCDAPRLTSGYFVPEQDTYNHETNLTYACENGYKPAAEGWWATSTCQNGTWSPKPQCIDQTACIPPTIPNAKYTENQNGWYEEGDKIRIICEESYEHKERHATATCSDGTWSSVPVCERSSLACGEPPKVLHAVIVDHRYQELFAADTELQYECVDGYTADGAGNDKTIVCIAGAWTEGPTCRSSSSSGSNMRDTDRRLTTINRCGTPPKIQDAEVVRTLRRSVKYQCNSYYKRLGPESVRCYSDGTWSELPTCEASFCVVNTLEYPDLKPAGDKYIEDGEDVRLECVNKWSFDNYSDGHCNNGIIHLSRCCTKAQLLFKKCDGFLTKGNGRLPLDFGPD